MSSLRSRAWCFTVNNPVDEIDDPASWPNIDYLVYQLEEGESGTVHFQGYLHVKNPIRLSTLKAIHPTAHFEARKGTHEQARAYCMKQPRLDGPYEYGEPPAQGKRSDWSAILEQVKGGISDRELLEIYPRQFAVNNRAIQVMRTTLLEKRNWPMVVNVYWGAPGSGKTRLVQTETEGMPVYWKDPGNKWFDGYQGESVVIFDDFKCNWFSLGVLLRLLDRYPMKVESKGGSMEFQARTIYITSQCHPREWYSTSITPPETQAILRRLTNVVYFGPDPPAVGDAVQFIGYHESPAPSNII